MKTPLIGHWLCGLATVIVGASSASATDAADGKALLERNCSRCHAVAPGLEELRLKGAPICGLFWVITRPSASSSN